MKLDLGCGLNKIEDAIGIDNSPYSGADYLLDLNRDPLPFADNSIDYFYSSHCLEHLKKEGFLHTIKEVYRVGKNGSQIYIHVPYWNSTGNLSNPFHNNNLCFNEFTFRFFSSEEKTDALPEKEYITTSAKVWGLRGSVNEDLNIELKTINIDMRYFSAYKNLSPKEKFEARQKDNNVVEFIHYHLQIIKPCPNILTKKTEYNYEAYHNIIKENNMQGLGREGDLYKLNELLYPAIEIINMINYKGK